MKLTIKLVLFLLFIYNILFSNFAIAQDEPKCPIRIYETGLYLGWGSALLEYTRERETPSSFDQVIIEQLYGAYNSVELAAIACEPAIPAWPGWRQKQKYLLNQAEKLQNTTDHKFKRGRVYNNINSTYYSWGADLSIMVFDGQTINTTTCATCYFQLGFSTAYAAQAFRQGEEALNRNNDVKEAKRQMKLASGYLMRALKVLETYRDIQQPRGSIIILCCDLNNLDLKNRISALIRNSRDPDNVANCILKANSISSDIKNTLDNYRESGSNNNSYEYCRSKYCPECDNQIVLLETAVNKDCQKCLDKNKELIAKCMNNGSSPNPEPINPNPDPIPNPSPVSSGTKCPLKNADGTYLVIDSNNNPSDKTQVKCSYSSSGLLKYQSPQKNGKNHGEYRLYNISKNIHYVMEYGTYNNGRKDGVWKTYHLPNSSGKVVLASEKIYNNGVKILEEFYDSRDFLSKRIQYLNGKKSEQTRFFPNGRKSSYITYTPDGKKSSYKAWYNDGREK